MPKRITISVTSNSGSYLGRIELTVSDCTNELDLIKSIKKNHNIKSYEVIGIDDQDSELLDVFNSCLRIINQNNLIKNMNKNCENKEAFYDLEKEFS